MAGYSQNDPAWAGQTLGASPVWKMGTVNGDTAHAAGCYVTAGADVLRAFGYNITPGDLNQLATAHGLINENGDITRSDWLAILFPNVLTYVETKNWGSALADLHYLNIRSDLNTEIIIEIDDSPAGGMQTHFMRTVGWDGNEDMSKADVVVDDSWDGIRKGVNAYGGRWNPAVHAAAIIYTAVKYVRNQPAPTPPPAPLPVDIPVPAPAPAPVVVEPAPSQPPAPKPVVSTVTPTLLQAVIAFIKRLLGLK